MKTGALRFFVSQPKQKESSEQKPESAQTKEEQQDFSEPAQIPEKLSDDGDLSDARDPVKNPQKTPKMTLLIRTKALR